MNPLRLLAALAVALTSCSTNAPPAPWTIQVVNSQGVPLPNAWVSLSGDGHPSIQTDNHGTIAFNYDMSSSMPPANVDGCPVGLFQTNKTEDQTTWLLVVSDSLKALCQQAVFFKVNGPFGKKIHWGSQVDLAYLDAWKSQWRTFLADSTTLDAAGHGKLRFGGLANPFFDQPAISLRIDGISFGSGWWVNPTDSSITIPWPPRLSVRHVGSEFYFNSNLISPSDSLHFWYTYESGYMVQRTPIGGAVPSGSTRTRGRILRIDTVNVGVWENTTDTFYWRFYDMEGALDGVWLDTGSGAGPWRIIR